MVGLVLVMWRGVVMWWMEGYCMSLTGMIPSIVMSNLVLDIEIDIHYLKCRTLFHNFHPIQVPKPVPSFMMLQCPTRF